MESTVKISVKTEKVASCNVRFDVMVPQELVAPVFKKVRKEYVNKAKLPGFRPGKAPLSMINRMFGAQITAEATGDLLQTYVSQAIKDNDCGEKLMLRPELASQDYIAAEDKPFEFSFTATLRPELPNLEYKGLALTKTVRTVSDKDVDATIENYRKMSTSFDKTEEAAKLNDMAIVDYAAEIPEGVEIDASANYLLKATSSWMPLREPGRLPGIAAILDGKKAGDACDAEIAFPEDFDNEALRGKTLKYHFDVKEIRKEVVPELNDEFAARLGVKDIAGLKEAVRGQLKNQADQKTQNELYMQIENTFFDKVECEMPENVVDMQVRESLKQRIENEKRRGATQEEMTAKAAELEKEIKEQVVKAFRREFILMAIVKAEKLELTKEEQQAVIQQMIAREPSEDPQQLIKRMVNSGQFETAALNALLGKAMQTIINLAQVTEKQEEEAK